MADNGYTRDRTALLFVDPDDDFLSDSGKLLPLVEGVAREVVASGKMQSFAKERTALDNKRSRTHGLREGETGVQYGKWQATSFAHYERKGWIGMLWTICVILLVLWLLGLVSGYTMGGFVHVLLVIAIIVVVVRLIQGRRVV